MKFTDFSVVEVLKVGLSGLVFLLMFLFYRLLAREQDKKVPSTQILATAKGFLWTCVLLIVIVAGTSVGERYFEPQPPAMARARLDDCKQSLSRLGTLAAQGGQNVGSLRTLIANHIAVCGPAVEF